MIRKLLKFTGAFILFICLLVVAASILLRIYGPKYFIPYVINQVQEVTNGRYILSINSDSVKIHMISMSLDLGYTEFKRDSAVEDYSGVPLLDKFDVHATFESFRIDAFKLITFLISEKIMIHRILLDQPSIVIRKNIHYDLEKETAVSTDSLPPQSINYDADSVLADTLAWEEFHQSRDALTPHIEINEFQISKASFAFYDGHKTNPMQEVHGLDFKVKRFISDDEDDIEVEDAEIHIDSASSLVSKNIARLTVKGVYLHPDSVHINFLHFGHIVDRYRINRIKGFRASWLNIGVEDIEIQGLHPGKMISDSILNIDKASIGNVNLYLFKDKEELVINPAHKALPPEQLRSIPLPLLVDTVEIEKGKFTIDMQAAKAIKPGSITLDHFHAKILNITNIKEELANNPMMQLSADFVVMDSAKLNLDARFKIDSPEDRYWLSCQSKPFNASILNEFLGSQFFIEFPRGDITHLTFEFEGNNKANVGTMDMEYTNLKVQKLKDYEKYIEGKPNTGFIAGVGNLLIPRNRSHEHKNYKPAVIYYEKEYNRDFIHGTVMSLLSGVTSSLGFASKNLQKKEEKAGQLTEADTEKSAEIAVQKAEEAEKKEQPKD